MVKSTDTSVKRVCFDSLIVFKASLQARLPFKKIKLCPLKKAPPALIHLQDGYDDPEQPDGAAKDFHDEDLDEEAGVLGVRQRSSAAHDAHADAAEEVGEAHGQTGSEHGVALRGREREMVGLGVRDLPQGPGY